MYSHLQFCNSKWTVFPSLSMHTYINPPTHSCTFRGLQPYHSMMLQTHVNEVPNWLTWIHFKQLHLLGNQSRWSGWRWTWRPRSWSCTQTGGDKSHFLEFINAMRRREKKEKIAIKAPFIMPWHLETLHHRVHLSITGAQLMKAT